MNSSSYLSAFFVVLCVVPVCRSSETKMPPLSASAERLQERVAALEKTLWDKCGNEGETCGGTDEEKAQVSEGIRKVLLERLEVSRDADELVVISETAADCCLIWCVPVSDEECAHGKQTIRSTAAKRAVKFGPDNAAANMDVAMVLWEEAQQTIRNEQESMLRQWNLRPENTNQLPPTSIWTEPQEKQRPTFEKAERHAKHAIALTKDPPWVYYASLADIEDSLPGREAASFAAYQHALAAARREKNRTELEIEAGITLDRLWPLALNLGKISDAKEYHRQLENVKLLGDTDWNIYATRLRETGAYSDAADAFQKAAETGTEPIRKATYYASAASCFAVADRADAALAAARSALLIEGVDSEVKLQACIVMSDTLASRGVPDEALRYADEAVSARPDDHRGHHSRGNALYMLHRYQDAATELKTALKLSDGKFAYDHFLLGNIYFDMNAWADAAAQFKFAADMEKTDSAATYNLALCYENEGYRSDAADAFEETLRRDQKHPKRDHILREIERLRARN